MKHLLSALLALMLFISCSKDKETIDYVAKNEQEIKDYIAKNNLTAVRSNTGLYYVITNPGTGAQPTASSNVTVAYKGYFTNGTVFFILYDYQSWNWSTTNSLFECNRSIQRLFY